MHKIGENVLYGSGGVMTVVDIREERITDAPRTYYVLRSALGRSESLVFVPVDSEKLTAFMHKLLSKEGVDRLLASDIDTSVIEWSENNRVRTEYFKRIMESGDRPTMLAMARAIYERGIKRIEIGKKNFLSDESAKQKAEKLLSSEIAVVMDIDEAAAFEMVRKKIEQ